MAIPTGFGAPGPHHAVTGPARDVISIQTYAGGSSRKISNDLFEEKETQHVRLAEIFLKLKEQTRVFLTTTHHAANHAAITAHNAENARRATTGEAAIPLPTALISPFEGGNPSIGIIPENKTFIYINEKGERISGQLINLAFIYGVNDPAIAAEIENDVFEMVKILKDVKVLSSGGLPIKLFSYNRPYNTLHHDPILFNYMADRSKDEDLLSAFLDEILKRVGGSTDDAQRTQYRERLKRELSADGEPVHNNLFKKCDDLYASLESKASGMGGNTEVQELLSSSIKSADLFAAKLVVILRHMMDSERERYAGLIMDAEARQAASAMGSPARAQIDVELTRLRQEQGNIKGNLQAAVKEIVQTQRESHEKSAGWYDAKYHLGYREIDQEQKTKEDSFIDKLLDVASNDNPQENPTSLEDILLVGPLHVMKQTDFGGLTDAERTQVRGNLVRLDKLIGFGTSHHYQAINVVRRDPAEGILYPGAARPIVDLMAGLPPHVPGHVPVVHGDPEGADHAGRLYD